MSTGSSVSPSSAAATGLRVVAAALLCVVLTEWLHLELGYLSTFTTLIVMAAFPFTSFQKGLERLVGRAIGVGYGLLLVPFFHTTPFLLVVLLAAGQMVAFYVYASNRLAYSALQTGVFVPAVAYVGLTSNPGAAVPTAVNILIQIILGVGAAMLVNWLTGAEHSLDIVTQGEPLLPVNLHWLSLAAMLTLTSLTTMFACLALDLPVIPATVSSLLLAMTTDLHALRIKAEQRALGVVLGGGYSFLALLVLGRLPHFPLLLAFLALGLFVAASITRGSARYSYVGLQAGIAIGMVLVGAGDTPGSIEIAVQRFLGVVIGVAASVTIHSLWDAAQPRAQ